MVLVNPPSDRLLLMLVEVRPTLAQKVNTLTRKNFMNIEIIIYLALGVLMNFIGPLASKINRERNKISLYDSLTEREPPLYKKILFQIIVRTIAILFYPVLYIGLIVDYYRSKRNFSSRTN